MQGQNIIQKVPIVISGALNNKSVHFFGVIIVWLTWVFKKKMGENSIAIDNEKYTFILRSKLENTRKITQNYCAFKIGETLKDQIQYGLNLGKGQLILLFL
jgi:hypothetical protein